jgi:hypothetical protein
MFEDEILYYLKNLRLSSHIVQISESIKAESHQEFLLKLLNQEFLRRENAKNDRLVKTAGFYTLKAFEAFRFDEVTLPEGIGPDYLKNLKFLETATNIVMYGNVGSGNYRKFLFMERFSENTHEICLSINENLSIIFGNSYLQKPCSQLKRSVSSCQIGMSCVTTSI